MPSAKKTALLARLKEVEKVATGSKLARLVRSPRKYTAAMFFRYVMYPITKRSISAQADTFFNLKMNVLLPASTDIYLTSSKSHISEIRLAEYLINHLSEGDYFIDIGAHFGFFSNLAAHLVSNAGKVYAFEASPNTFSILSKNSKSENLISLNKAVASESGQIEFYEFPSIYSEYNSTNAAQYDEENWVNKNAPKKVIVEAVSLDDFIPTIDQKRIAIIKIDVEGGEANVISGGLQFLPTSNAHVVVEFLIKDQTKANYEKAEELLKNIGFLPYRIVPDGQLELIEGSILASMKSRNEHSTNIVFKKSI